MRIVKKWKRGWIMIHTNKGDDVFVRNSEIVWLVRKPTNKTWIVVRGNNETYWEVDSTIDQVWDEMGEEKV